MATIQPNEYLLRGLDVEVSYLTSGFQNQPSLTYNDGQQVLTFKGAEIRVLNTEIGQLVSVTIRLTVDTGSTSYSVLIPAINLANTQTPEKFYTVGIRTVHKTPLVLPATGPRETYHIDQLEGKARVVEVPLTAQAAGA
ncbi:MAG: hypothetical protein ACRD3D_07540 [Terriglobia bacterium]